MHIQDLIRNYIKGLMLQEKSSNHTANLEIFREGFIFVKLRNDKITLPFTDVYKVNHASVAIFYVANMS